MQTRKSSASSYFTSAFYSSRSSSSPSRQLESNIAIAFQRFLKPNSRFMGNFTVGWCHEFNKLQIKQRLGMEFLNFP